MSPVFYGPWARRLGLLAPALAALAVIAALAALGYSRITGAFEPPSAGLTENRQAHHTLQSAVELISGVLLLTGVFGVAVLAALGLVTSTAHNFHERVRMTVTVSLVAVIAGLFALPITQIQGGPATGPATGPPWSAPESQSATVHPAQTYPVKTYPGDGQ